jgi:hypothetical protein
MAPLPVPMQIREATLAEIVGRECRRRVRRGRNARTTKRCPNTVCDFALNLEHVLESSVPTFGPDVKSVLGIDELRCDAESVACLAHASFEHGLHAQTAADFPDVVRAMLECKG